MSSLIWTLCLGCLIYASATNFVLILGDDQGWGDVSFNNIHYNTTTSYKINQPHTPHLDEMANSDATIIFHRMYSASAVCSPTRSSILSGRTPKRECISTAEGCGSKPALSCLDRLPFPPTIFTIAQAAKAANLTTAHFGKWHLGDFMLKSHGEANKLNANDPHRHPVPDKKSGYAYKKWPVSNPGMHGFDTWRSTEASASSSTTNCDCNPLWGQEGEGCIASGGVWSQHGDGCTNYWTPAPNAAEVCRNISSPNNILAQVCVINETKKIVGDDSQYIVDHFETFVQKNIAANTSFLALLWLHTVHEPHPALPEYYHAYTDAFGDPAGDYLGTMTQLDVQIGRIRQILNMTGIRNDTIVMYTADNGAMPTGRDRSLFPALAATNGLRQCKASYYEGGIRVPGLFEWPAMIHKNSKTWYPASSTDFLPTIMELLDVSHPHPTFASDGISLLPLIKKLSEHPSQNDTTRRSTNHPLHCEGAIIDNEWKFIPNPEKGLCKLERGTIVGRPVLFNLDLDPTETHDLCSVHVSLCSKYKKQWSDLQESIQHSQQYESLCQKPMGEGAEL